MATKKSSFAGPMKKAKSKAKSVGVKHSPMPAKPMKDCGCGGHGER